MTILTWYTQLAAQDIILYTLFTAAVAAALTHYLRQTTYARKMTGKLPQLVMTFCYQDVDNSMKACACMIYHRHLPVIELKRYFAIQKAGSGEVVSPMRLVETPTVAGPPQPSVRLGRDERDTFWVVTAHRVMGQAWIHARACQLPIGDYTVRIRLQVDGRPLECVNSVRVTNTLPYIEWVLPDHKVTIRPIADIQEPVG